MAERKVRVTDPFGQEKDAVDVPITESQERWNEYTLEDGTVLRVKLVAMSVSRVDGEYDAEGSPMYLFKATITQTVVSVPAELKKKKV